MKYYGIYSKKTWQNDNMGRIVWKIIENDFTVYLYSCLKKFIIKQCKEKAGQAVPRPLHHFAVI